MELFSSSFHSSSFFSSPSAFPVPASCGTVGMPLTATAAARVATQPPRKRMRRKMARGDGVNPVNGQPWSEDEVAALRAGMAKYGASYAKWVNIRNDPQLGQKFDARARTAADLRDRWRTEGGTTIHTHKRKKVRAERAETV